MRIFIKNPSVAKRKLSISAVTVLSILSLISFQSYSQVSIPGDHFNTIEKYQDTTSLTFYTSIGYSKEDKSISWINPLVRTSFNSNYPRGYNDGPVWKGKGLTFEGHAGFQGKRGKLSYTFLPTFYYSQNSSFELAPNTNAAINQYNYQFSNRIDWVQQYGTDGFAAFHPGQSEIKLTFGKFVSSVSTQNYTVGPSNFNPIILSRQGGGFPHLRLGLEPLDVVVKKKEIGKIEVNFLAGQLVESEYFDSNVENDERYINGLFLAYSPSFLPGLTLGFNKMLYKQSQYYEPEDLISVVKILDKGIKAGDTLSPNDTFDQLASMTVNWNFPEVGFRAYLEFAKNDFSGPFLWTLLEPEHSRAYTLGFERIMALAGNRTLVINYEHTNLSKNSTFLYRAEPPFYAHSINRQGYTHNGQILGAGIGPGGNSDNLSVNLLHEANSFGFLFQRIETDKDYFIVNLQNVLDHNQEYSIGLFYQKESERSIFSLSAIASRNFNRNFAGNESNLFVSSSFRFKIFNQ